MPEPDRFRAVFATKPMSVEAIRVDQALTFARTEWLRLPNFLVNAYERGEVIFAPTAILLIRGQSRATAAPTDWLVGPQPTQAIDVISADLFAAIFFSEVNA